MTKLFARNAPFGYKWVVRYTQEDGQKGMGLTDHHFGLSSMITRLLLEKSRDITITDETIYKDE
jgi:hypothetical protein